MKYKGPETIFETRFEIYGFLSRLLKLRKSKLSSVEPTCKYTVEQLGNHKT